ncbi:MULTISPECIES: DUF2092 domain-containing protein [Rhizobium]|uniref:DUF2092 domain-containing protein n=1 Tax=Rhizobium TaxID=379 RepID=UPI001B345589|nr:MULTISPECIES: DUF2092 domain-containing protein [Rhizobium]MBX4911986.1 DUF2092 domain-containing protein [Rhizobium bangladeshense]MBX5224813.1 DUF2092 domain-containing protein [Rhizobium sp. NLR8a]MBX5254814.1 DUF2092 domain-containing protein [Rhizobium sp. NLR4b]MBX5260929.1 DUF2092 domain-containing protein [Rhizobium sp. NLR16b]MBX5267018.1 DUF2092 domain-containing protein [Rhizobium sp. NLR16a]
MSSTFPFPLLKRMLIYASVSAGLVLPTSAWADDAKELLKKMSDFLTAQKTISFTYQSSLEAVTPAFEKLQFVSSGIVNLTRPDKLRVTRTGGFADIDVSFDGSSLTVHGKNLDAYAKIDGKGSLDDLIDRLMTAGIEAPGADLLSSNVYGELMSDVTEAKHISSAFVDGVECEYLAFRTPEIDWQIWIQTGAQPIPRRYVITSKHVVQAPQYMLEISDFKSGADVAAVSYNIEIPGSAKTVDLSELQSLDELPAAADAGEAK